MPNTRSVTSPKRVSNLSNTKLFYAKSGCFLIFLLSLQCLSIFLQLLNCTSKVSEIFDMAKILCNFLLLRNLLILLNQNGADFRMKQFILMAAAAMRAAMRVCSAARMQHTMRGRALMRMSLMVCLLTVAQGAWADRFLQEPGNFTAIVQGIDRIRFTLPTQLDDTQNEGIVEGVIYVSENGGEKREFLTWGLGEDGYNDLTSDSESGKITLRVTYDGEWQLVGKVTKGHRYFQKNTDVIFTVGSNDDDSDRFTTVVDWTVPRELRGKRFTFYLWCKSEASRWSWYIPDGVKDKSSTYLMAEWDCPAAAEVNVDLGEPVLSYSANQAGSILIPYTIQAKSVIEATIFYTDAITGTNYSKRLSTKLVDMANLPADRPWKDIYIRAKLLDSESQDVSITSNMVTSKMMHFPKDLTAKIQTNGEVLLTWKVDNAEIEDLDDGDFFEVQRNVTGNTDANDGGWTTIAMEEQFVRNQNTYTFIDNTLLDRYTATEEYGYARVENYEIIMSVLDSLGETDRQIFDLRFRDGRSQSEVADILGVSQMTISRAERAMKEKFREELRK